MVVFPVSVREDTAIRWAARVVPAVAAVVILLLSAISVAAAQV